MVRISRLFWEFLERAKSELEDITFSEEKLAQLEQERSKQFARCYELARSLSAARRAAAEEFTAKIQEELQFLDMSVVRFLPVFREKTLSAMGMDDFELQVSTNVGEEPKPLAKIASGGELSRIMLAMKNVLSDRDNVGTMIFDEIDTGVSGRAAQKIGRKLHEVSAGHQVICVTRPGSGGGLCRSSSVHQQKGAGWENLYQCGITGGRGTNPGTGPDHRR